MGSVNILIGNIQGLIEGFLNVPLNQEDLDTTLKKTRDVAKDGNRGIANE